ncbi:MAG TPA: transcriptional regulator GutM [Thermoflexales bacterium]|jgi:DNA-binding transcriptional regulator of glucitol operon|nr:hypothetical protein [Anaerolineae bacterium]HQV27471.1 transcriptional regulator GutM [Thermoflexales bacterium]HQX09946.1 transcriptional regulator GutM [Thermoflexales bacterium]HQY23349.1 transcriptional regulator GutM [Thermoflexales bacterium]HQZ52684.1 transcriptional regulator GutM [Thermoflexales bacterium]
MDNFLENYGWMIGLLVAMWLLQFFMSFLQMKRYYSRLSALRREGPTATGMTGNRLNTRTYGVLTLNKADNTIRRAEQLSGFTVFSSLRPVPALVGMPLDAVVPDRKPQRGVSTKEWKAFCAAADYLRKHVEATAQAGAKPALPTVSQEVALSQA